MCRIWTTVRVCFNCRVGFEDSFTCPQCGGELVHMGGASSNFKIPKKRDKKQWEKVKRLYDAGVRFGPASCCRRSDPDNDPLPKYLWQVDNFLATDEKVQSRKSEGERLLEKWKRANGGKQ
jgi:hypothetical protein